MQAMNHRGTTTPPPDLKGGVKRGRADRQGEGGRR